MRYDDFPILNNDEYNLINFNYNNQKTFNRKTQITNIYSQIADCKNSCFSLSSKHNQKINQTLFDSTEILTKLENNLKSLSNLNFSNRKNIKDISLFSLLKNLILINKNLMEWTSQETKEYYKTIANNSMLDIFNIIEKILTSLESSNILFFKYM